MKALHQCIAGAAIALPLSLAALSGHSVDSDILTTAESAGTFTTLLEAVESTGLEDMLKGEGPFTVFAPTDAAFAKLPDGTLEALMRPENEAALVELLSYHVIAGKVTTADIAGKMTAYETLEGSELTIDAAGRAAKVNHAAIEQPGVVASNGVLHAIDKVMALE